MVQEYFQFGFDKTISRNDFIVSTSNFNAFSYIQRWPNWESNLLLIYGAKSCGKSHLAKIWQTMTGATLLSPKKIYANDFSTLQNYLVEDIEQIADEAAFLHFFNAMKEHGGGFLLMTANNNPASLGVRLPDLRSRLAAIPSARVADPDDELLKQIFVKQFSDRQLKVEMDVINYLVSRIERSFDTVYQIVNLLDHTSMQEKKNITIPFVRKCLETLAEE